MTVILMPELHKIIETKEFHYCLTEASKWSGEICEYSSQIKASLGYIILQPYLCNVLRIIE